MKRLPPLHQAILDKDENAVKRLSKDPQALEMQDALGFTAVELAHLLNHKWAAALLAPQPKRWIAAKLKGSNKQQRLTEEEFQRHFHIAYSPYLSFANYDALKRVLANCPWILAKSFLGEENRSQAHEYRKQLDTGRCAAISIRWIDEQLGYGIFADRDLPEGTFIGEFTGTVRQLSRRAPTQNVYCFHYPTRFWSWNYYVIDALETGNETRFINHSDSPNLQPLCLCERRLLHIVFIAKVTIKAGTQLTYDYGQDFWKSREKINL